MAVVGEIGSSVSSSSANVWLLLLLASRCLLSFRAEYLDLPLEYLLSLSSAPCLVRSSSSRTPGVLLLLLTKRLVYLLDGSSSLAGRVLVYVLVGDSSLWNLDLPYVGSSLVLGELSLVSLATALRASRGPMSVLAISLLVVFFVSSSDSSSLSVSSSLLDSFSLVAGDVGATLLVLEPADARAGSAGAASAPLPRAKYFCLTSSVVYAAPVPRMALDVDDSVDVLESELAERTAFLSTGASGPEGRLTGIGVLVVFR